MNGFISNFPILAVMALFLGAFIASLAGRRSAVVRNVIVFLSMAVSLVLILCLIKPVFIDGGIIVEDSEPQEFFAHPKNKRLQDFLSKML